MAAKSVVANCSRSCSSSTNSSSSSNNNNNKKKSSRSSSKRNIRRHRHRRNRRRKRRGTKQTRKLHLLMIVLFLLENSAPSTSYRVCILYFLKVIKLNGFLTNSFTLAVFYFDVLGGKRCRQLSNLRRQPTPAHYWATQPNAMRVCAVRFCFLGLNRSPFKNYIFKF